MTTSRIGATAVNDAAERLNLRDNSNTLQRLHHGLEKPLLHIGELIAQPVHVGVVRFRMAQGCDAIQAT